MLPADGFSEGDTGADFSAEALLDEDDEDEEGEFVLDGVLVDEVTGADIGAAAGAVCPESVLVFCGAGATLLLLILVYPK